MEGRPEIGLRGLASFFDARVEIIARVLPCVHPSEGGSVEG